MPFDNEKNEAIKQAEKLYGSVEELLDTAKQTLAQVGQEEASNINGFLRQEAPMLQNIEAFIQNIENTQTLEELENLETEDHINNTIQYINNSLPESLEQLEQ